MQCRLHAALSFVAEYITIDSFSLVSELIDANELEIALEAIVDSTQESERQFSTHFLAELKSIVEDMGITLDL